MFTLKSESSKLRIINFQRWKSHHHQDSPRINRHTSHKRSVNIWCVCVFLLLLFSLKQKTKTSQRFSQRVCEWYFSENVILDYFRALHILADGQNAKEIPSTTHLLSYQLICYHTAPNVHEFNMNMRMYAMYACMLRHFWCACEYLRLISIIPFQ